jgi:Ca2+-binding EF-hand superfamily protein
MSLYGIGLDVEVKRIILKLKLNISKRKACIYGLRRIFKRYDADSSGKLSPSSFEEALAEFGLFTTQKEQQALTKYFGKDNALCYNSFLKKFREPLSKRRYDLIIKVFSGIDVGKKGAICGTKCPEGFAS